MGQEAIRRGVSVSAACCILSQFSPKIGLHAKQNFKNLANLANYVKFCLKIRQRTIKGFLTKLARLARFLKF